QGKLKEEEQAYREALRLEPGNPTASFNLGHCLQRQGRLPEAEEVYRNTVRRLDQLLDGATTRDNLLLVRSKNFAQIPLRSVFGGGLQLPRDYLRPCNNLGVLLHETGRLDEALQVLDKGLKRDPADPKGHYNRGNVLIDLKRPDDARAAFSEAIKHRPDYDEAYNGLGNALLGMGDLEPARLAYTRAIELNPKEPGYWHNWGLLAERMGRFDLAANAAQEEVRLLPPGDPNRAKAEARLSACRQFAALDRRLPAVVRGEAGAASPDEWLALINLAARRQAYTTAARLCRRAFAEAPLLTADPGKGNRFGAACLAARAAGGEGDGQLLDEVDRARWRKQAVEWLRADLAALDALLALGAPGQRGAAAKAAEAWQREKALAGLRDPGALRRLPDPEREACARLWADVAALRRKAEAGK
ncbi:MAG TPA: tetratricopeptide repeat protein, partial [Gemmataceae bacterium]|nr:tetratricopeptide repeat protein [Gemmataceae bacterium]